MAFKRGSRVFDPPRTSPSTFGSAKMAQNGLGPVLETIENALRADRAKMIEAE